MSKILIVDDDPSMVVVLSEVLKDKRHEVIPANSAERALQLIAEHSPDLVLADVEMPEGKPTGLDLLHKIKQSNRLVPVVMMISAQSTKEHAVKALRMGAEDFIQKPFKIDELVERVQKSLSQQKPESPQAVSAKPVEKTTKVAKILVVDDDAAMLEALSQVLKTRDYETLCANSKEHAMELVKAEAPDLVLTDIEMPEGKPSGMELLREIKEFNRTIPVMMVTAQHTDEREIESLRLDAYDYIRKPFRMDEVLKRVEHALFHQKAVHALSENVALKRQLRDKFSFENIVGTSAPMQEVFHLVERVADTDSTVLVIGESGTGKELVARALHYNSRRAAMPFVAVDCGALPEQLLESELFGHRKGAFTGAVFDRNGLFREADGGSILLDEVSSMSSALQSKLLRVLQEKEIRRVGDNTTAKVDVRVLAATNEPLEKKIAEGKFREDLYYRLNVISIVIPPLRDRRDDVALITDSFLKRLSARNGKTMQIAPDALKLLEAYSWPGNVRELENVLERGAVLSEDGLVKPEDLPTYLVNSLQQGSAILANPTLTTALPVGASDGSQSPMLLDEFVAHQERNYIQAVISKMDGSKEKAAQALGVSLATLYRKLKAPQVEVPELVA